MWFTSPKRGRRKENPIHASRTFLLPFTPPEEQALKMSLRHLAEKVLTRVWDTADSRLAEAGAQRAHLASAPCSQEPW